MTSLSLVQRLSLQQKLSPQQILLSTLLQLPTLALEQKLKMEMEINPLLELEDEIEDDLEMSDDTDQDEVNDETDELSDNEEIDWEEILNDQDHFEIKLPKDRNEYELEPIERDIPTLYEHLLAQLHLLSLTDHEFEIGEYIIWNIDEDGYLACPVDIIARNLNVAVEEVEVVLEIVQSFEPTGIAARDLKECLIIQLKAQDPKNQMAIDIVQNSFEDFKTKRFENIAVVLQTSLDNIKDKLDVISKLNPKPGEGYFKADQNYVIPDIAIEKVDNAFEIILNDRNIPRLRINDAYRKLLFDKTNEDKTRSFIQNKLESARWLINSIHQRRITIIKVMTAIIKRQIDFFEKGTGHLKPMILKNIADDIFMDISTISRATSGKYVQTDYGVFPMKYFFTERMVTNEGESISTQKIKSKMREIIQNENHQKPYTDSDLVKLLKNSGFPIARRTVAKYREQLIIPVARMRRQI